MDFIEFQKNYEKVAPAIYSSAKCKLPLLSICVQTYNHENYISECLDTLINQKTLFEYEIILGEDNSSDNTRSICKQYADKYPEIITLILHEDDNKIKVNSKTTGNFNALYNYYSCRGKYIAFCEGDDYWTDRNKLQQQVNFLEEKTEFAFCFHRFKMLNNEGEIINTLDQPLQDISKVQLIENMTHHPLLSTICFRNNFMELPFQISEVLNVDTFLLSLLGQTGPAKYMKDISPSIYRVHRNGIWSNRFAKEKYLLKIHTYTKLQQYYISINNFQVSEIYNRKIKKYKKFLLYNLVTNLDFKGFFSLLRN
jgi:glycosyltransferase involved in cell wall biosynthesis